MNKSLWLKRLMGYSVVLLGMALGIYLIWNTANDRRFWGICIGIIIIVVIIGLFFWIRQPPATSREDIVRIVENEFPAHQRQQVYKILEPFTENGKYYEIHKIILSRAKGSMEEVEKLANIAKPYAFDPRERYYLITEPDRFFSDESNTADFQVSTSSKIGNEQDSWETHTAPEAIHAPSADMEIKPISKFLVILSLLIVAIVVMGAAGYFLGIGQTINIVCRKTTDNQLNNEIMCELSKQFFGLELSTRTLQDVKGARLVVEERTSSKGVGTETTYHVTIITSEGEISPTTWESSDSVPLQNVVDQINQYVQDPKQEPLQTNLSPVSNKDMIGPLIGVIVIAGYYILKKLRK